MYNVDHIIESGKEIAALIEHERILLGNVDYSNIYLAGFGSGARMVYQVQLGQLSKPLGGAFVFMGYPMIPMFGFHLTTYKENDMAWMMFYGQNDIIYEPKASRKLTEEWFEARDLTDVIKYSDIVYDLEHLIEPSCLNVMLDYI